MTRRAENSLRGRRESALLALPSVSRLVDVLGGLCRESSWIRTAVASLDRFAALTRLDLETLLERSRRDEREAGRALTAFAAALSPSTRPQIAALAIGPKLWFTLNGVAVPWRPLPGADWSVEGMRSTAPVDRLILLGLVGSGLHRAELLRLRLGDVGALDTRGRFVMDIDADPLAIRFIQRRDERTYVTFFTDLAREALQTNLAQRRAAGEHLDPSSALVPGANGSMPTRATFARAQRINTALIDAGNAVNVDLCRTTGAFFRTWGPPGSRFVEQPA